jgi:hypothetical protein
MAGPYFLFWRAKFTEAWYQLSEDEQNGLMAKHNELFETTGGENILGCNASWSSEQWMMIGVHKFPDMDAVHKHSENLWALNWHRYVDGETVLATEWPSS